MSCCGFVRNAIDGPEDVAAGRVASHRVDRFVLEKQQAFRTLSARGRARGGVPLEREAPVVGHAAQPACLEARAIASGEGLHRPQSSPASMAQEERVLSRDRAAADVRAYADTKALADAQRASVRKASRRRSGVPEEAQQLMGLVRACRVRPIPVDERPLVEANGVIADLRAGAVTGRAVLRP